MKNLKIKNQKLKAIIAMSGGVDSGVAAALLKRQGFDTFGRLSVNPEDIRPNSVEGQSRRVDVVGVFLRLFDSSQYKDAEKRARKISKFLGIPFFVLDLRKEFKKKIIDYFLKELKRGRTPNPCVVCNKEIKFEFLLKEAKRRRINFVATGHYARIRNTRLFCAEDKEKDQSYFLWKLTQKQLKNILFPLGDYTKGEVRSLAKKLGILKFVRSESQEICFIKGRPDDFLKKHFKQKAGKIVNIKGEIIGKHQGLAFYTIGQRSGIGLGGGKPYYVLNKNLKKNILIVTRREKDLDKKELIAEKVNWISGKQPKLPIRVRAKIRYRHKMANAILTQNSKLKTQSHNSKLKTNKKYKIIFTKAQRAITPGQSVVFYKGQELLGGGIID